MAEKTFSSTAKCCGTIYALICCYCIWTGFDALNRTGRVEGTRKNGDGCICHGDHVPTDSVVVWIGGPDTVELGNVAQYTLFMIGGPALAGGFNVASWTGVLLPFDSTSQVISSELTHNAPKPFVNDTVQWKFYYHAPASGNADTLYGVGNSVDLNGLPAGDQYDFSANFVVHLKDTTTGVEGEQSPQLFHLYQNYPNPFNSRTTLKFDLPASAGVRGQNSELDLKVYDIRGREVATLIKELKYPGQYAVSWDAHGVSSGIYFYRLRVGKFSESKKMLLIQ